MPITGWIAIPRPDRHVLHADQTVRNPYGAVRRRFHSLLYFPPQWPA